MRSPYCYNCNVSISQRFKIRGKATRSVNGVTHTSLLQKYKIDLYGNLENNDHESDDYRFPESFLSYEDYKNLQALLQNAVKRIRINLIPHVAQKFRMPTILCVQSMSGASNCAKPQ